MTEVNIWSLGDQYPIFIRTLNNGGVAMRATAESDIVYFSAEEWAALVASMSAYGDTPAAVEFTRLLHTGALDDTPPFRRRVDVDGESA
jgi:hypothetical protein